MTDPARSIGRVWRDKLARLRALHVHLVEVAPGPSERLFARFAREFIDPERLPAFLEEVRQAGEQGAILHYDRWLRADCAAPQRSRGCLSWLAGGKDSVHCVRFDRHARIPAVTVALDTMEDAWAASWPGLFVHFDAGRALAVSVDYELTRCDLRGARASPYR